MSSLQSKKRKKFIPISESLLSMLEEGFMSSKFPGRCGYENCKHGVKINVGQRIFWNSSPKIVMHEDCYKEYLNKSGNTDVTPTSTVASAASKPILSKNGDRYIISFKYDEAVKDMVKSKKFIFDRDRKYWWTGDAATAARLIEYVPDSDVELKKELQPYVDAKEISRSTGEEPKPEGASPDSPIPAPEGLKYLPFQESGIRFAMGKDKVFIADEMGLGKTIQAIGYINVYDSDIQNVLILCPQKLKYNWKNELEKWLISKRKITVVDNKKAFPAKMGGIIIVNYDIIYDLKKQIDEMGEFDLVIADEAHYMKNKTAKRSMAILGTHPYDARKMNPKDVKKPVQTKRALFLTGTPIDNKPQDLFALLHYLDPNRWNNYFTFITKYCGATQGRYGLEYNTPKDSDMEALQDLLRSTIMVRRLKKDVLKDIPPKTRSIITFESSAKEKAEELQIRDELRKETEELVAYIELAKSNDDLSQFNKYTQELEQKQRIFFETISQQRSLLGIQKLPHIIEHAEKVLKSGEKIIIFAHHREVVQRLQQHFGKRSVMLIGGAAADEVTDIVDEFQTNPDVKVFIGSILASATGLTLTAATTVIFGEFDWRPTTIIQAEDRAHRIGQTKNVEIHYLAAKDSIDEIMIRSFINKAGVNDKILDKKETSGEDIVFVDHPVDVAGEYVTKNVTPEQIRKEAQDPTITDEVKEACLKLLQIIAGMDEDFAQVKNNVGFNKIDGIIGHSLANQHKLSNKQAVIARKLCNKYRRQLSGSPELKVVLDSLASSKTVKKESFSRKSTFDILCEGIYINSFRLKS